MRHSLVTAMTATINMWIVSLAGLTIGWILALRALGDLSPFGPLAGTGFLVLVIWGLIRSTKV